MRKIAAGLGLLTVLALAAGPAFAFEQTGPAPVQPNSSTPAAGAPNAPAVPGISTAVPAPGQTQLAPEPGGKESDGVSVPGLGTFDFLPKMDFGLELLYGEPAKVDSPIDPLHDQDVTIRGTVKRRF